MTRTTSILAAAAAVILVAGCANSAATPAASPAGTGRPSVEADLPPSPAGSPSGMAVTATVTLADTCAYDGPGTVPAGPMRIRLVNETSGRFEIDLWLLDDDGSYDDLVAHIAEETRRAEAGEPGLGHPTFARLVGEGDTSGASGQLDIVVAEGTHGFACILFTPDDRGGIWPAGPFVVAG